MLNRRETLRTTKETDHACRDQNGDKSLVKIERTSSPANSGYIAPITLAVDPSASPQPVGMGG